MVFDLIDGETRARPRKLLKRGGVLVSTLTEPSRENAREFGVRALHYTVDADGRELVVEGKICLGGAFGRRSRR